MRPALLALQSLPTSLPRGTPYSASPVPKKGAAALTAAGAEVHRGSLDDLDNLTGGARAADGVIHTAFNHNFATYLANCEADIGIVKAPRRRPRAVRGPLLVTSGTGASKDGQKAADFSVHPRLKSEQAAAELAAQGVRASGHTASAVCPWPGAITASCR